MRTLKCSRDLKRVSKIDDEMNETLAIAWCKKQSVKIIVSQKLYKNKLVNEEEEDISHGIRSLINIIIIIFLGKCGNFFFIFVFFSLSLATNYLILLLNVHKLGPWWSLSCKNYHHDILHFHISYTKQTTLLFYASIMFA